MAQAGLGRTALTTIRLQLAIVLAAGGVAWSAAGTEAGISCLAGGAAVALPNALFALSLCLRARVAGSLSMTTFLLGEFLKLGLTVGLLYLSAKRLESVVVWWALLVGVVMALKAQWLALWFSRDA